MAPVATENAAPSSTAAAAAGAAGAPASAPLPGSLEEATHRYNTTKAALQAGLAKKRIIDRTLTDLESQIYLFEGSYLASTAASGGNIIKGFDSYLKTTAPASSSAAAAAAAAAATGAANVPDEDRMFSLSSATYQRSLELKANESRESSPHASAAHNGEGTKAGRASTPQSTGNADKERNSTPKTNSGGSKLKRKEPSGSHATGGKAVHKKKREDE